MNEMFSRCPKLVFDDVVLCCMFKTTVALWGGFIRQAA